MLKIFFKILFKHLGNLGTSLIVVSYIAIILKDYTGLYNLTVLVISIVFGVIFVIIDALYNSFLGATYE